MAQLAFIYFIDHLIQNSQTVGTSGRITQFILYLLHMMQYQAKNRELIQ